MGLKCGSGLGPEPGAGGAAGTADRVVEVVGEHAGGGCERGGVLVVGGQDVEDVEDEHLVDAFELAARHLVAGAYLPRWRLVGLSARRAW